MDWYASCASQWLDARLGRTGHDLRLRDNSRYQSCRSRPAPSCAKIPVCYRGYPRFMTKSPLSSQGFPTPGAYNRIGGEGHRWVRLP